MLLTASLYVKGGEHVNDDLLVSLIDETKFDDGQAILELIDFFKPIIIKYSKKLRYDDAKHDMQTDFICVIDRLKNNLDNESDKYVLSYVKKSMYHSYIKYSKKNNKYSNEVPLTSFGNDTQYIIDNNLNTRDDYSSVLLDEIKAHLTKKEFLVIKYIFFKDYTINDVALAFGVSRQSVNQTKKRALDKLREFYEDRGGSRGNNKSHRNVCA